MKVQQNCCCAAGSSVVPGNVGRVDWDIPLIDTFPVDEKVTAKASLNSRTLPIKMSLLKKYNEKNARDTVIAACWIIDKK